MNPPQAPLQQEENQALEMFRYDSVNKLPTRFKSEPEIHGYYKQKRRELDREWKDKYLAQVMVWIESQ